MSVTAPRLSALQRQKDFETHLYRRDRIIEDVGQNMLGAFEMWAFKAKTPMVYDSRVIFIWECAHGTKLKKNDDVDKAIEEIVGLWKSRFELSEGMFYGDE